MTKIELIYHGLVVSKKNSRVAGRNPRTGRQYVAMNARARNNQNDMVTVFRNQLSIGLDASPMIVDPCKISIKLYEPNWQLRDIDNQATSILDALVAAKVIKNDDVRHVQKLNVTMAGVDKDDSRAEITIEINHEITTEKNND